MKVVTRLIASAASKEELLKMIAKFFCNKPEHYRIGDCGMLWAKMTDDTESWMKGFRIVEKKGRFRFEAVS